MDVFDKDFLGFIDILNKNKVEYLLVRGQAVNIHGRSRHTGDMDIYKYIYWNHTGKRRKTL